MHQLRTTCWTKSIIICILADASLHEATDDMHNAGILQAHRHTSRHDKARWGDTGRGEARSGGAGRDETRRAEHPERRDWTDWAIPGAAVRPVHRSLVFTIYNINQVSYTSLQNHEHTIFHVNWFQEHECRLTSDLYARRKTLFVLGWNAEALHSSF